MGTILHGFDVTSATSLDEILSEADLDFGVELADVTVEGTKVPGRAAVVQADTRQVFGIVTDSYVPKSARDSFAIVDELLSSGRAKPIQAGALRDGREAFIQLVLDRDLRIGGDTNELVQNYLLLHTGFDGHHALRGAVEPFRFACTNQLPFPGQKRDRTIRFSHTSSIEQRLMAAAETLELVDAYIDEFETTANDLIAAKFSVPQMRSFLSRLIPLPKDANPDKDRAARNKQEARDAIMAIFQNGENLANVRETKWAAYNAVGEYFDHTVTQRTRVAESDEVIAENLRRENTFMRVMEDTKLKDKAYALLAA